MLNTHIFLDTVIDGFAYICDKYWFRLRYSALSQKSKQKYCLHCNFYTQCHSLSYSSVIGSLLHNLFHWQLWVVSSLLLPKQIFKKIKFWRWFQVWYMHLGAMNPQHVFERALISSETSYPWDPFKKMQYWWALLSITVL